MKEEKLEQLKVIFKELILKSISNLQFLNIVDQDFNVPNYSKKISEQLVYEVKNRINDKEEVNHEIKMD